MTEIRLVAKSCRHGGWQPHNGWLIDGEFVADPDGLCPGGTVEHDGKVRGLSHAVGMYMEGFDPEFAKERATQ